MNRRKLVLKCIQINLMRSKTATSALSKIIEDMSIDIILVQEPYVVNNRVAGIPMPYEVICCDINQKPKTVIIIINRNIRYVKVDSFTNAVLNHTIIEFNNQKIYVFNAYCAQNEDIKRQLKVIETAIQKFDSKSVLVSMDSNSHSNVWFDKNCDKRAEEVLDFVSNNDLIILNNNENKPTFDNIRSQSSIDLTMCSNNLINTVKNWSILDIDSMSDHNYIYFELNHSLSKSVFTSTLIYNTLKADWNEFEADFRPKLQNFENKINLINNCQKLNNFVDKFIYELHKTCDKTIPKFKTNEFYKKNKWWTTELSLMRSEVNRTRRQYQRSRTEIRSELKAIYLEIKNKYKVLINESKIKSWNRFVTESTADNPWGLIYKISRNNSKQDIITELKTKDNRLITDTKQIAEQLLDTLFPTDRPEKDNEYHKWVRLYSQINVNTENDICFSPFEVTLLINKQNWKKAPGYDSITADIIQNINKINNNFLTKLYNKCLSLCHFPNSWKTSVVKVIPKPGKTDYTDPNAYRPISLISVFGKILEKLIINRLMYFLKSNHLLNKNQFGFSEQNSTETTIHKTINFVKNAFQEKAFAIIISFDISGAFNCAWWPKIIKHLIDKKCPKNLIQMCKKS